jgi:putative membrane protein
MPHLNHGASGSLGTGLATLMLAFTALIYLRGWVSLRANSLTRIPTWRACSFLVGLFLIWLAVASRFATLDHQLLTVHMVKHLLLMTIAPPLIWLGEPVRCVTHALPQIWRRTIAAPRQSRGTLTLCWLAAVAALIGWHIPALFTLAMQSAGWHFAEQASFLVTGLLFWWPVVEPWPSVWKPEISILLYLFFATLPCDILSGFLVFCDRVVYPVYSSPSQHFGFTVLGDQQCAAALMWTCVTVVYLAAAAILAVKLLSTQNSRHDDFEHADLHVRSVPRRLEAV